MAPAKVNLNLCITGKRSDGYHLLESDVVFTAFGDKLLIQASSADSFQITGPYAESLTTDHSSNICQMAIDLFRTHGGDIGPIDIILEKHIPVGAGLGGGSADGAATLRYLNQQADTPLSEDQLLLVAAQLGADVPVCLKSTSQHMSGIGDVLTDMTLPLHKDQEIHILLANPRCHLSTADVFNAFSLQSIDTRNPLDNMSPHSILARMSLGNDLTHSATQLIPQIETLLKDLGKQHGVIQAAMSGSGASCFALFHNKKSCQEAEALLQKCGYWAVASSII